MKLTEISVSTVVRQGTEQCQVSLRAKEGGIRISAQGLGYTYLEATKAAYQNLNERLSDLGFDPIMPELPEQVGNVSAD